MRDNPPDPIFFSAEESPIHIPSVDGAWSKMEKKLDDDNRLPIGWWHIARRPVLVGIVAISILARFAIHIHSVHERTLSVRRDSIHSSNASAENLVGKERLHRVLPAGDSAGSRVASTNNRPATNDNPVANDKPTPHDKPAPGATAAPGTTPAPGATTIRNVTPTPDATPDDKSIAFSPLPSASLLQYPFRGSPDIAYPSLRPDQVNTQSNAAKAENPANAENPAMAENAAKTRKGATLRKSFMMAAGLSLAQNAPLGNQELYPFNINGNSNLLSDYIPAPYFQYYLRKNLYVQISFRFNSPQYVHPLVTDSPRTSTTSHVVVFTTSTLQKLYYTDIPLTVDYSPSPHWFLGAGLQYSGLRGGFVYQRVVSYDSASLLPTAYHTAKLGKAMEQAIQLRNVDWRVLLEANYHWNRVTIGLRYQQGLSDFSKPPANAATGSGREINKAAGIYLQYDLWERRRR